MKKSFLIILIGILLIQCCSTQRIVRGDFKNEHYYYILKDGAKSEQLVIYVPDLPVSMLDAQILSKISRASSVYLPFLADSNELRQQQLDNLQNRKDYYSYILQQITNDVEGQEIILVAEGINANLISQFAFAFPIDHLIFVNPYKPDLEQSYISSCFGSTTNASCDSLLQHLQLNSILELESLVNSIQSTTKDEKVGLYTMSFWQDVYRLRCDARANKFDGKLSYVYTNNSGLAQIRDSNNTVDRANLYKRLKEIISN